MELMNEEPTTPRPAAASSAPPSSATPKETAPATQERSSLPTQSGQAPDSVTTRTVYRAPRRTVRISVPDGWARGILNGVESALMGWGFTTLLCLLTYWSVSDNPWMGKTEWSHAMTAGATLWGATLGGDILIPENTELGIPAMLLRAIPLLLTLGTVAALRVFLLAGRKFPPTAHFYAIPGFVGMSAMLVAANHAWLGWGRFLAGALAISLTATIWAYMVDRRMKNGASAHQKDHNTQKNYTSPLENNATVSPEKQTNTQPSQEKLGLLTHLHPNYGPSLRRGLHWGIRVLLASGTAALSVVLIAVALRWEAVIGIGQVLAPASAWDVTLIVVGQLLFIPNIMAWTLAWGSGVGISLGTDAVHSIGQATVAPIPPIPLLGVLPTQAPGAWWLLLPIATSAMIGLAWGRGTIRRHSLSEDSVAILTMLFSALLGFAIWLDLSQMILGSARLSHVGPFPYAAAGALVAEICLPISALYLITHPHFIYGVKLGVFRAHTASAHTTIGTKLGLRVPSQEPVKPELATPATPKEDSKIDEEQDSSANEMIVENPAERPHDATELPEASEATNDTATPQEFSDETADQDTDNAVGQGDEDSEDKTRFPVTGETPAGLVRLNSQEEARAHSETSNEDDTSVAENASDAEPLAKEEDDPRD